MQIDIDTHLSAKLESKARLNGISARALVVDILEHAINDKNQKSTKGRITLPVFSSKLQPGVDLSNREQIWELADSKE